MKYLVQVETIVDGKVYNKGDIVENPKMWVQGLEEIKEPKEVAKEPKEVAKEPEEVAKEPKEPKEVVKEPEEVTEEAKEPKEAKEELLIDDSSNVSVEEDEVLGD